jgi:IclR family transcriptional regulator, acetate operon repressor
MAKRGRKPAIALERRSRSIQRQPRQERAQVVQSVVRAINLLNCLAESSDGISLTGAAQRTGLSAPTAHRILTTLQQEQYTRFDAERRSWFVGVQAFVTGNAFARNRSLVETARPRMRQLMLDTGETVNLAIEDDGEAVYLVQVESRQTVRAIAGPGSRASLHCSAMGKALLAAMPREHAAGIVTRRGMPRLTPNTLISWPALQADLERCRQRGYALDDQEHSFGLRCIASAIYNEHGDAFSAISISGPALRFPHSRIPSLGRFVKEAAQSITAALGGRIVLQA